MAKPGPMDHLRELAEKKLNDTAIRLGSAQQSYVQETSRLEQLHTYAHEYRQQLQDSIRTSSVSILSLQTQQNFLASLDGVVAQQVRRVSVSQHKVDSEKDAWKQDKRRLNAFQTLKDRADKQQLLKENRLEQKMMDEFARRAASQRQL
ncbi:flagellar export protein FliJ [Kosakonia radicincitans DSM 16656]|uniref:flagellar export protein FliJ n=1 Tax=Kosakonia radicincitans TaxID=283686 RepID=UPI000272E9FE|nr:flagellar export protein FliJ [Kosakonia radicincitans]ARD59515.1 flagellar export protein FliJ [Kosakonia radicincitans DSM 16656]